MSILDKITKQMIANGRYTGSKVLIQAPKLTRVIFDPTNKEHHRIYKTFLEGKGWPDGVTFEIELPHTSVPATVNSKIIKHFIGM